MDTDIHRWENQKSAFICVNLWLIIFLLSSCAPKTQTPTISAEDAHAEALHQMQTAITEQVNMRLRLSRVSLPVLSRNVEACGDDAAWHTGFHGRTVGTADEIAKEAWNNLYSVDEKLTVIGVIPGSPAESAGLQVRDKIILINGEEKPLFGSLGGRVTDWSKGDNKVLKLRVLRNNTHHDIIIEGRKACYSPVILQESDDVNAFADGSAIMVTRGMMKFIESDDELALIIGHEMAHNTMGHSLSKLGNRMAGFLLDATLIVLSGGVYSGTSISNAAGMAYSQEFEAEADYVGCYYTELGGYNCKAAAGLWRRMASAQPNAINLQGTTHPSTAKRFLALEKAVEEIEKKKANGQPLEPEMKN